MPIAETVLGGLLKAASDWIADVRKSAREDKVTIDDSHARNCLISHIAWVEQWASKISMLSLRSDKRLNDAFIDLTLDIGFTRYSDREYDESAKSSERTVTTSDLHRTQGHAAILGRPGAGKTTTLQRIAYLTLVDWEGGAKGVPILVMLRDLLEGESLTSNLLVKLGISVQTSSRDTPQQRRVWEQRVLIGYLNQVSAILLVDGLDELDPALRPGVETELRDIALAPGNHRLLLTCRTAEYSVALKNVQVYTILPLSSKKVEVFSRQWLGEERGNEFIKAIIWNPYAGTEVLPLMLAHLCAIYDRDGFLPPRPVDVYEAIVSLLIEQWDRERGIRRASKYSDFSARKKERFLQAIAFELSLAGRKGSFRHDDFRRVYHKINVLFGLPAEEEEAVVQEVESHTGLLVQSGYRKYEFMHLVIQEFLTAMHAQRLPNGMQFLFPGFPDEMALVTAYSTNAGEYIEEVLKLAYPVRAEKDAQRFLSIYTVRIWIENVTIENSARNGWVLLLLLHLLTSQRTTRGRSPNFYTDDLLLFVEDTAVAAIRTAAHQASVTQKANGVRVIPGPSADLPPFMDETMVQDGLFIRDEGAASFALRNLPMSS